MEITSLEIRENTHRLLQKVGDAASICPYDVAKAISNRGWKVVMPNIHNTLKDMALEGEINLTQGGEVVDPLLRRGVYRVRQSTPVR